MLCEHKDQVDAGALSTPIHAAHDASDILFTRYARTHDPHLRDKLVLCHEKLVKQIAGKFSSRGEPFEDIVQVGTIGLIKAIDRFDPVRHIKFSTYAVPTIVGEIRRYLRDKGWGIKVSRQLKELYFTAAKVKAQLTSNLGRPPSIAEIASNLHVSEDEIVEAMRLELVRYTVSSTNATPGGPEATDQLALDGLFGEPDESITTMPLHIDIEHALDGLSPRQRTIIIDCYFNDMTQTEVGHMLHVSQMQVSRLHRRALQVLKARMRLDSTV